MVSPLDEQNELILLQIGVSAHSPNYARKHDFKPSIVKQIRPGLLEATTKQKPGYLAELSVSGPEGVDPLRRQLFIGDALRLAPGAPVGHRVSAELFPPAPHCHPATSMNRCHRRSSLDHEKERRWCGERVDNAEKLHQAYLPPEFDREKTR
ncbi:hypothetical protein GWI33_016518 [Rhynchophorus ferrugineus]|uniref:Uncharacterized protein n=1 Tax=Rhynchophorus ferrugineus TaxID=354439 RepID=A0A834I0R3_RHYFE|nr:hypothetical protein GWI33_016518 [Rhynchophorus ferrugineus]